MKKSILLLLLLFALVSSWVFAQNQNERKARINHQQSGSSIMGYHSDIRGETIDTVFNANLHISDNNHFSIVSPGSEYKSVDISPAYPNPASTSATLEYVIPDGANGKLLLRNLTGKLVREVNLERTEGKVVISTNDLKDGLYFYSVLLNNRIELTRKLMVRH
jgi:hypothetical protein